MTRGIYKKILLLLVFFIFISPINIDYASAYMGPEYANSVAKQAAQIRNEKINTLKAEHIKLSEEFGVATGKGIPFANTARRAAVASELFELMGRGVDYTQFIAESDKKYNETAKKTIESIAEDKRTEEQKKDLGDVTKNIDIQNSLIAEQEKQREEARLEAERRTAEAKARAEEEIKIACPGLWSGTLGENVLCLTANVSYHFILGTANRVFILVSKGFDSVMKLAVVNMKETLGLCRTPESGGKCEDSKTNVVNIGWTIFRDIANILFIFVLLYASIKTIVQGTGETGKTISTVIIVAVLINFSMFFTKVVIDISNTLAVSFYNSIQSKKYAGATTQSSSSSATATNSSSSAAAKSVLDPLVDKTQILSIVGLTKKELAEGSKSPLSYAIIIKQSLMGAGFIIILSIIIAIMMLMLLTRVLILGFLVMLSSLAFGAYILPGLRSKITDKWWAALIGQSFFAPVFLLMLYISLAFMSSFNGPAATGLDNILADDGRAADAVIQFFIVAALMIIALQVAKSMADQAGSFSGKITGALGGAALGLTGWAARNTLGATASVISNRMGDPKSATGLAMKRMLDGTAGMSFDGRNAPGVGSLLKTTGVDFGKASKDNFEDAQKKREIAAGKRAKMMSNDKNPDDPEGRTYREIYQTGKMAFIRGRGDSAVRAKKLAHKEEQAAAETKAREVQDKRGDLARDKETHLGNLSDGNKTHAQHTTDLKKSQDELDVLKNAKAQAVASGNQRQAAQIQSDIDDQNTNKATAEAAIKRMKEATEQEFKEKHEKLEKEIKKASEALEEVIKAGKKIGAEDDVDNKALLKALKEKKKDDD